jgi:hypothetical protein
VTDEDELARRRAERDRPVYPAGAADRGCGAAHRGWAASVAVRGAARLDALQSIVVEVADELDDRGVHDLGERLRGALPVRI